MRSDEYNFSLLNSYFFDTLRSKDTLALRLPGNPVKNKKPGNTITSQFIVVGA
jgi:hypothetical protein